MLFRREGCHSADIFAFAIFDYSRISTPLFDDIALFHSFLAFIFINDYHIADHFQLISFAYAGAILMTARLSLRFDTPFRRADAVPIARAIRQPLSLIFILPAFAMTPLALFARYADAIEVAQPGFSLLVDCCRPSWLRLPRQISS